MNEESSVTNTSRDFPKEIASIEARFKGRITDLHVWSFLRHSSRVSQTWIDLHEFTSFTSCGNRGPVGTVIIPKPELGKLDFLVFLFSMSDQFLQLR